VHEGVGLGASSLNGAVADIKIEGESWHSVLARHGRSAKKKKSLIVRHSKEGVDFGKGRELHKCFCIPSPDTM
jgi:hypothetical protein